jgi:predicted S18 family serine protease
VHEGTEQARQTAEEVLPAVGELITKTLYGTFYYAAFGVTFTALTIAKLIPTDSPVAHGLHDGAEAATRQFEAHAAQQARMAAAAAGEGSGVPVRAEGPNPT